MKRRKIFGGGGHKKKEKKGLLGLFDNIRKVAKKVGIAALLPWKPMMVLALQKRGVPVTMKDRIGKVAQLFNDKIVQGKQHLDYRDYGMFEHLGEEAAIAVGAGLIDSILDFIQRLKDKKARGEKLSADEENILNGAEKATSAIDEAATEAAKNKAKNWFTEFWYVWVILAITAVVLIVKRAKRGK